MIEISFVALEATLVIAWLLVRIALGMKRARMDWQRELLLILMLVNVAVVLRFTMFPFDMVNGQVQPLPFEPALAFPPRLNLIPLAELFTYDSTRDLLINIIGNCAMFIPTGIILPIVHPKLNSFGKAVGAGALLSLAIEITQLPFYTRVTDANDLMLNAAGVAIGYGLHKSIERPSRKSRGS